MCKVKIEILLNDPSYAPKLPSSFTYQKLNVKWSKTKKKFY